MHLVPAIRTHSRTFLPVLALGLLLSAALTGCEKKVSPYSSEIADLNAEHEQLLTEEKTLQDEYQRLNEAFNAVRNHPVLRKGGSTPEQKAEAATNEIKSLQTTQAELSSAVESLRKELFSYKQKFL